MNNEITYCESCGQKIAEYRVGITPMMIKTLIKFKRAVIEKGENAVHLLKDMENKEYELSRHEWNNFTRLRFHALTAKVKGESGYWLITKRGSDFLTGKISIPKHVWIRNNRVVDYSAESVSLKDIIGMNLYMEKLEDIVYRSFEPKQEGLL